MEAVQEPDARKYVWTGAIPLQVHLHESEVTTLPAPPPVLASYIMNGSTKNIMNMSQADQMELWRCVAKGRIPLRLYLRDIRENLDDLSVAPSVESWDEITYINRPVELPKDEGLILTLGAALAIVLPELFANSMSVEDSKSLTDFANKCTKSTSEDESTGGSADTSQAESNNENGSPSSSRDDSIALYRPSSTQTARDQGIDLKSYEELPKTSFRGRIGVIRVQGIEPNLDLPFDWVVQNLVAPEHFLHICLYTLSVAR